MKFLRISPVERVRANEFSNTDLRSVHSVNTVDLRSTSNIKLSHISSTPYRPRVIRIRRRRLQEIDYGNKPKYGARKLIRSPQILSTRSLHQTKPVVQRDLSSIHGSFCTGISDTKVSKT